MIELASRETPQKMTLDGETQPVEDPLSSDTNDQSSQNNIANNNQWANEGLRRVRSHNVHKQMQYLTGIAALGGFLFGYDTGVISGAMLQIRQRFRLTNRQEEMVVSITVFAALISSLCFGGRLNHQYGRKGCLKGAAIVFIMGSVILSVSFDLTSLLIGRLVVGLGIGIASLTTPLYIAEMAIPNWRGRLVTTNALLITVGQFSAGMVDGIFISIDSGWRWMLGLAMLPAIVLWIGLLGLEESPRWLCLHDRFDEARIVMQKYRESDDEVQAELEDIRESLRTASTSEPSVTPLSRDTEEEHDTISQEYGSVGIAEDGQGISPVSTATRGNSGDSWQALVAMLKDAPTRRALVLGCGIMLIQQFSGINTGKCSLLLKQ